ncbi:Alpha-methylacyl-CoA racemase [Nymphon striatum]|nr:Alpha-methylacyl-CoA racemase [Nymphon striatum]
MSGPLSSVKVIEMVGLGPCPLAGQLLADMGAEVIVVDRKSGSDISTEVNRRGKSVSGKGQVVDAAMVDGVPAMMGMIHSMLKQGTWVNQRQNNFVDGGAPYYRCYECQDGKFLSVGCIEPQFFAEFLKLAKLDASLGKQQNDKSVWPTMHQLFEKTLASKSRDEWAAVFEGTDACVAPVLDFHEAIEYPHNVARKAFITQNGVSQTSPAPRFSSSDTPPPKPAMETGKEASQILHDIGMSESEIKALASSGILL